MFATIIILIIIVLCVGNFYLKSTALTSFATVISAVFAMILAFNYYEPLAGLILSKFNLGQWAHPVCLLLLFVVGFVVSRVLVDLLIGANIDFGVLATRITAIVSGIIVGLIISGVVVTVLVMSPMSKKLSYTRFDTSAGFQNPDTLVINADGFVAGLFNWISRGAMSSGKSFAVYHPDFVNQLHLNQFDAGENKVYPIAGEKAVVVPGKGGVRTTAIDGRNLTIVRMGILGSDIIKGGAKAPDGTVSFTFSQLRVICKKKQQLLATTGTAKAFSPIGFMHGTELETLSLDTVTTFNREDFQNTLSPRGCAWRDVVFEIPDDMSAILLEFKQNVVINLPKSVTATDELVEQLGSAAPPDPNDNL